jgi:transposase
MKKFIRIGVDLGKNYLQIHALDSEDGRALTRKLRRQDARKFFSGVEPCLIGMEACGSSHYWARELAAMGHEVRLIPPIYVKPYVKRGKNDAADAAAICEAMSRPGMRFVPVKKAEDQATLALHKTRDLLVRQRTMNVNSLRGLLWEFGVVVAKGIGRVEELIEKAKQDANLPEAVRALVKVYVEVLDAIETQIVALNEEIESVHARSETSRLIAEVPGVGKIAASVIAASLPDPSIFRSGRDFAAWLGLTPKQNSSGGKEKLGAITKKGNAYIRRLLVLGSTSLLRVAGKRKGTLRDWIVALRARKGARVVTVALANKLARIIWAILASGESFRRETFAKA